MGALIPLVFYISLLSNSVMDLSGRGQENRPGGEGSKENNNSNGEWVAEEKKIEIGENYPSFLLSLKPSRLKNSSQASEYDINESFEYIPDDADFDTHTVVLSGNESVKLMSNKSLGNIMYFAILF